MSASVAIRFNAITGDAERAFTNLTRTAAGFEKAFAGVASSVAGHQERMNQAFAQFSGDKLIREANELAGAIQRVGGATKLTNAEQQQVNRTITEAIAKYRALGLEAPQSLTALANATKQLEQPTTAASKAMGILGSAFGQFTLANLAASAISSVVSKLGDFAAQGAKLPGLQASFERLARGVGENSADMLRSLQTATRGMVADIDLMQSANKALLLGLPVTKDSMAELAKTATVLGKAMGQDATSSLNDLITALGRSSPLILDNLGLTVKVGEANEAYAAKLGKTVEAMTDAEKKMAFYEAAMEAARAKTEQLGEQSKTLGEILETVWVSIGNKVTQAVGDINVVVGKALTTFKDFEALVRNIPTLGVAGAIGAAAARERQQKPTPVMLEGVSFEEFARNDERKQKQALEDLAIAAKQAMAPLAALTEQQRLLAVQFAQGGKDAKFIAEELNKVTLTSGVTERQLQPLVDTVRNSTKATSGYADSVRTLSRQLSGAELQTGVKKLSDALRDIQRRGQDTPETLRRVADAALELQKNGAKLTPELSQITIETGRLQASMGPVVYGLDATKLGFVNVTASIKQTADELADLLDLMNDPKLRGVVGVPSQLPGWQFTPTLPEPLGPTFLQQFLGPSDSFLRQTRQIADNVIQTFGDAFATGDWSQVRESLKRSFVEFMGAGIAAAVNLLVPGLGTLLQPLLTGLSAAFLRVFDRNRGRDIVESFADSLGGFDALHARLARMGAEGDRLWRQLTQGVGRNNPEQARRAVEAVTEALARQERQVAETRTEVTNLVQQYLGAGVQIPASLQASIDQLIDMGVLTRENAADILGLAQTAVPSFAEISRAAEILGVNIEAIGENVKNIRFAEKAAEIAAAFLTLERGGADMTAVFVQSVETVQPLVTEALRFGRELPEAMRPFLERMAELGLLTDENGQKLTDLSRLNFAEPLTKKLDDLIVKIGELIEAITGGIGGALDNLSRRRVTVPIRIEVENPENVPGGVLVPGVPALARGGIVRRPTLALVGEAGPEAVVPLSQFGHAEPPTSTIIIEAEGRNLAEIVVPHIPGVVRRYGLV